MKLHFLSGAIIDSSTTAKAGDELDVPESLGRALVAEGIATSLEPTASPIRAFFVDGENGSDSNDGLSISTAFATIAEALSAAVSGRGDVVCIMPASYEETLVVTKDYVSLIGLLPGGYARPDVVPTSGIPLTVRAQGVVIERMRFAATAADCVLQKGNGFRFTDCVFDGDGTASKAGVRLRSDNTDDSFTASEGVIEKSLFRGCAIGLAFDTGDPAVGVGSTDNQISDNRFYSNTLDVAAEKTGAAGTYSVKTTVIERNVFADKNKTCYIDLTTNADGAAGNQSGSIAGNVFAADAINSTRVKMAGTGFSFAGNYDTAGLVDGSGLD